MSLRLIQLKQKQLIEAEVYKLLDLQRQTEQNRDVATSPIERAKFELEIDVLKSSIEKYNNELQSLESEIKDEEKTQNKSRTRMESYRVRLDDSLPEEKLNTDFATEIQDLLSLMEYEIDKELIPGRAIAMPPTFIATQEGDFKPLKTLFQGVYSIVDENAVVSFNNIYELNRKHLVLNSGIIITNTYIAPSARSLANQYKIQLLTFEDLLNTIFKVTRYLKAKCRDYEQNNKLYHTYVEIKYLRRGKGKFKDGQATRQEFLVTEAIDGSSFETKGDLTPYVDSWLPMDGNSQICLLGEYGSGKTSFASQYFYRRAIAYLENPMKNRIPLLVTLNRYHKSADIEQMMTDFLVNECGIHRDFDTFLKLAVRGKLLIILDGFDEMAKQVDVNIRRHNFREISRLLVGKNKVILSGRPNYFLTQAEIEELFSQEPQAEDPYRAAIRKITSSDISKYELLTITLFDRWQIEEFLKKQSEYLKVKGIDDWRGLQRTIYETYNLEELARTPVLLEIIIKTISEIRGKVSHINAAKLYQIYTDFWLDREYDEKGDVRWLVTRTDKELFVLNLAWTMLLTDNLSPEIHFSKLSERVRSYFGLEKASEIEYFSSDIRFCSYLTHSATDGNYRFIHKSFMEYFSARRIYTALFDEQHISEIVTDRPIKEEVFFFLCQMVDPDRIDLLRKLSREENDKENKEFIISLTARILQQSLNIHERRGAIQPAEDWADKLLLYCEEFGFNEGRLWGTIAKGRLRAQLGQYEEAETYYQNALSLSEQLGDKPSVSQSFIQLGTICQSRGELDRALEYYQNALATFEEIGYKVNIGQTLLNIGTVFQSRGELTEALEYYQNALAIFNEIDDRVSVGQTLTNIGEIFQTLGDVERSLQYSQQALAIFREIGDRRREGRALSQLGDVYHFMGRYDESERIFQEALTVAQEIGDRQGVSHALSKIGSIYISLARYADAEKYYSDALVISEELGDRQGVGNALTNVGRIYQRMARYDEAAYVYQKSISILESVGDMRTVGISLYNLANVYSEQGRFQESNELYGQSLGIFERIGDLQSKCKVMHQLGIMSQTAKDYGQADTLYRKARETYEKIGDMRGVQDVLESLGDLSEVMQNYPEAEKHYTQALEISLKLADQRGECELSVRLGNLARMTGDTKKVLEFYGRYLELAQKMNLPLLANVVQEYKQLMAQRVNPFIVSIPVLEEAFYGRNRELDELYRCIQRQENVILMGERRMGKTSLLLHLNKRLELPFVSVFINLQSFYGQAEGLLYGVLRQILSVLLKAGLLSSERWEKFSLTYAQDFVKALESMIDEAKEKLKDIKIVLMLDEAELILELGSEVTGVLRSSLITNHGTVTMILSSGIQVKLPEDNLGSPLLNIFTRMILRPLNREDTETLIKESSRQVGISYEPAALERIFELSGGIPSYAQGIGSSIIASAIVKMKNRISLNDVNKIIPEILEKFSFIFKGNISQLNAYEKSILLLIMKGNSLKDIRKQSVLDLENKQMIIEEKGSYRLLSVLFEEWLKINMPYEIN